MKGLDNNMDEVFFDYYEGNLSENEKTELFSLLDDNPSLHHDFMLWKNAYVHEPLPPIGAMERSLIKHEKWSFTAKTYAALGIAACAGIMVLFWLITAERKLDQKSNVLNTPIKENNEPAVSDFSQSTNKVILKKNITRPTNKNQLPSVKENFQPRVSSIDTVTARLDMVKEKNSDIVSDVSIDTFNIDTEPLQLEENVIENMTQQAMPLSKKELKKIQKAKERAKIRRQEQEFLKGDQPYVVPIDPNRF